MEIITNLQLWTSGGNRMQRKRARRPKLLGEFCAGNLKRRRIEYVIRSAVRPKLGCFTSAATQSCKFARWAAKFQLITMHSVPATKQPHQIYGGDGNRNRKQHECLEAGTQESGAPVTAKTTIIHSQRGTISVHRIQGTHQISTTA